MEKSRSVLSHFRIFSENKGSSSKLDLMILYKNSNLDIEAINSASSTAIEILLSIFHAFGTKGSEEKGS